MDKNRILEQYHSKKGYIIIRIFVNIIASFVYLPIIINSLNLFYKWFLGEVEVLNLVRSIIIFILSIGSWLFFDRIFNSCFLSSLKVEDNMRFLPSTVKGKKTLVQYDLPKNITPSEVGMLLYGKAEISNMLCLVYKWINEKKVKIFYKDGKTLLDKKQDLSENAPVYEKYLFTYIFKNMKELKTNIFENMKEKTYVPSFNNFDLQFNAVFLKFNDMLAKTCMEKGYMDNGNLNFVLRKLMSDEYEKEKKPINMNELAMIDLMFLIFCSGSLHIILNVTNVFSLGSFFRECLLVILFVLGFINAYLNRRYYVNLTDKGKKVLADIVGYKYYLENCEEEQINSDLEENEVYNKHLPYAIALKLNWKIIDELL